MPDTAVTDTDTDTFLTPLKQHYLFNRIEEPEFTGLVRRIRTVTLDTGEALFHQDEPARRFYLVREGQIKLSRVSAAGQEKVIEIMMPGHTFAEAVMFMRRENYPVTAQALMPSTVYAIPNEAYRDILRQSTEACFRLLADLSIKLHSRVQELDQLAQQNATYRLIRHLTNRLPADCGPQAEVELDVPKHVLASKLSIKPESFSRLLNSLSQQGIITVENKRILVHDVHRLKHFE